MHPELPRRFQIKHPLLTPELYRASDSLTERKVRALHIYQNIKRSPEVIHDTPDNILNDVFFKFPHRCFHFDNGFHMYASAMQGYYSLGENVLATYLMRLHYATTLGFYLPDTLYGDVCIFGSSRAYMSYQNNKDYSVPYEIVEQTIHLYDKLS